MTLDRVILKQKLTFFGHIIRAQGLEAEVMLGMGNGARSRGRPRRRWIDEIVDVTGIALSKLTRIARDRDGWRRLVIVVTRGRPRPDGTR